MAPCDGTILPLSWFPPSRSLSSLPFSHSRKTCRIAPSALFSLLHADQNGRPSAVEMRAPERQPKSSHDAARVPRMTSGRMQGGWERAYHCARGAGRLDFQRAKAVPRRFLAAPCRTNTPVEGCIPVCCNHHEADPSHKAAAPPTLSLFGVL